MAGRESFPLDCVTACHAPQLLAPLQYFLRHRPEYRMYRTLLA